MSPVASERREAFEHIAAIYDSERELCQRVARFLDHGQRHQERIFVLVPPATERELRRVLPVELARVQFGLPDVSYAHLGRFYDGLRRFFDRQRDEATVVIGEFGYDGVAERVSQYLRYEAMCNTVFASFRVPMLCLCDRRRFPAEALARFRMVHARTLERDGAIVNPDYLGASTYLEQHDEVILQPATGDADFDLHLADLDSLGHLRHTVRAWRNLAGLEEDYADDVVIAVSEIATNGFQHAHPPIRVRGWGADTAVIVQVDDRGTIPVPPQVGYVRPHFSATGGRGMWLARHAADVLTAHRSPTGNCVRMRFPTT
ncbi:MAG: hypothetical protein GEV00_18565 [Actinophytocola sp.]|nr:hypothetical protein [Actinophytocola sp.]